MAVMTLGVVLVHVKSKHFDGDLVCLDDNVEAVMGGSDTPEDAHGVWYPSVREIVFTDDKDELERLKADLDQMLDEPETDTPGNRGRDWHEDTMTSPGEAG